MIYNYIVNLKNYSNISENITKENYKDSYEDKYKNNQPDDYEKNYKDNHKDNNQENDQNANTSNSTINKNIESYSNIDLVELDSYLETLKLSNIKSFNIPIHNRKIGNKKIHNEVIFYLNKILNNSLYVFNNIKLLNKIYYYKIQNGKYIELFKFSAIVSIKNKTSTKYLGNIIFAVDLILLDKTIKNTTYNSIQNLYISKEDNVNVILNDIKILSKNIDEKYYTDLFIHTTDNTEPDNENDSLIPSTIDFTDVSVNN